MKKIYFLFLALPITVFVLLNLSIWWCVGTIAAILIFIAYKYYSDRLDASETKSELLENELDEINIRLENAVVKEQKTSKEVEQVRQSKQKLLSVISHEIRTPMNGIMGTALLLTDTTLSKDQEEYVTTIRNCGEGLLTTVNNLLVNDILDYSKLKQEEKQLEYKDFDLRDCVEEVLEMFSGKTKPGVELLYDIQENVPEQIIGDNKRLRQVLMNLIENAVRYTDRGEINVVIHYTLHDTEGNVPQLYFEVRDTGTGIASDQLKQLFKGIPGRKSQPAENEITGLGLVICKKLIELMGGQIEVKSKLEEGTVFTFSIPLTPSLKSAPDRTRLYNMVNIEGKRILIVDDNASSRSILTRQVKAWKMVAVSAESGEQALKILSGKEIDIVLADTDIQERNIHLIKSIKDQYPNIPVIGMNTAGTEDLSQQISLFSLVINKPLRRLLLRDHIHSLFAQATDSSAATSSADAIFAELYPLRILVAEDNLINQKIATKILAKLGYQPELANNGKEALEMVSDEQYDIILMDVQMPEMDGLEASRMIRTCLQIQPIIIALTANAMQGDRDECMQAGMDDYMSKPIELKELVRQLEKWALTLKDRKKPSL
jgi:signal transduction histidine kinase/DNA-binding response OmpR family regulator